MSPSNHKIMSPSMNTATTTMTSSKKMASVYGGGGVTHHHHKDTKDSKDASSHAKGGGGGPQHHHRHHHSNNHHHNHNHNNNSSSTTATATTASNPSHPNPSPNSTNPANNSSSSSNNSKLSAYKADPYKTDFRRDVIAKRRELAKAHNLLQREKTQDRRLHGRVVSRNLVTIDTHKSRSNIDVLRMVIRDLGWREFPFPRRDHNCDVTWNAISFYDQPDIYSGQINKFPGTLEIFRKVNLFRWLEFMKNLFPEEYDFFPRTWLLPHQFSEFASEVRTMNEKKPKQKPVFIVKPSEGSQGEGIYLIRDPQQYTTSNGKTHVVQEYLNNVLLLEKFKFDFRVYVILRSLDPLEFHICREGLARFSTIPYEQPTKNNIHQTYMHLTNYSLNKKSPDFKISDKDEEGSKRKLLAVFKQMDKMGYDTEEIWAKIERLVAKTLIAVAGELKVEHQAAVPPGKPGPTCFQVLGFDILLVKSLDPILLEVNANPSLSITEEHESATGGIEYMISAKDEDVKRKLLRDTLILIAPKNKYTRKRRKYRRRRRHANYSSANEEEDMDVDNPNNNNNGSNSNNSSSNPHQHRHHRHHHHRRRERDISIKYMDAEDERFEDHPKRNRSIFDEGPRKFIRNETCRVFIEGEGEVLFTEQGPSNPKYFSSYKDADGNNANNDDTDNNNNNNNNNNNSNNNNKTGNSKSTGDTSDRLPSVFFKSGDRPADIIMEDDQEDGDTGKPPRPIPFDLSLLESSDEDEEEEESCLKEISSLYAEKFKSQRIVERLSDIFIACLGVKGCLRLGPTMFRLFARKCRLNRKGITNAAIDILYIDMQRKWEYMNPDRTSGLSFLAFFSSCVRLAENSFYGKSKMEQIINFTEHCHRSLRLHSILEEEAEMRSRERSSGAYSNKNNNRSHSGSRKFAAGGGIFKGESSGDLEDGVIWSDTVPLDEMQNMKISSDWPELLNTSFDDRTFMAPHRKHKNVFHMLQSIKK